MNSDEWLGFAALVTLATALVCIRGIGELAARSSIHACRWLFPRHRNRHSRRPR